MASVMVLKSPLPSCITVITLGAASAATKEGSRVAFLCANGPTLVLNHASNWALLAGIGVKSSDNTTLAVNNATMIATLIVDVLDFEIIFFLFSILFLCFCFVD
ncbi:hypothetical protein MtrunA17_Chr2g0314711 [Medicago truncatula]|uniref:Transmembrane protein n=1 Tax=Medicago truncatula TaxID=3880 RepID=A0A396JCP7_MEDTR|nr:hypothetical protein MtrunA17_Chr2g0314711 [Medicago truncatula]